MIVLSNMDVSTRRGDKNGSIKCHLCGHNHEGFCRLKKKWCNIVRQKCTIPVEGWQDDNRSVSKL